MALVGDPERERALARLRRHYAEGRLDDRELSDRLDLVLHARSRWEIAYALRGLPFLQDAVARGRYVLVVAMLGVTWLMLSVAMLTAFVVWIATHGATLAALIAFPLVWLALSGLLYRRAATSRRGLPRP